MSSRTMDSSRMLHARAAAAQPTAYSTDTQAVMRDSFMTQSSRIRKLGWHSSRIFMWPWLSSDRQTGCGLACFFWAKPPTCESLIRVQPIHWHGLRSEEAGRLRPLVGQSQVSIRHQIFLRGCAPPTSFPCGNRLEKWLFFFSCFLFRGILPSFDNIAYDLSFAFAQTHT